MNLFTGAGRVEPLNYTSHSWSLADLQAKQVALALVCEYQLRELMTHFWEMHFSTHFATLAAKAGDSSAVYYEWFENNGFRERALGNFVDLVAWSMDSPAMRLYLDLTVSCFHPERAANENYARELLELHTLGEGGGTLYSNDYDVPTAALILTGMKVNAVTGQSVLVPACHYRGPISLFANSPIGPYVKPGLPSSVANQQLRIREFREFLVSRSQTANFICGKLIQYFVGDHQSPDPTLLANCVNAWGVNGDIKAVLVQIFSSPQFRHPPATPPAWTRTRLPLEHTLAQARILEGSLNNPATLTELQSRLAGILSTIDASGAAPFTFPSPDGYPLASQRQIGTSTVWQNGHYAYRIYSDAVTNANDNLVYAPRTLLQAEVARLNLSWTSANDVATAALQLLFHGRYSSTDLARAVGILDADSSSGAPSLWPAPPGSTEEDRRIRLLVCFAQTLPQASER